MLTIEGKQGGAHNLIRAEFHLGLAHQIMRYIARLTAEGSSKELSVLGIDPAVIGRLSRMNIPEADKLSRLSTNFLNIGGLIDQDKLLLAIDYLERERARQETIDTLIRLRATLPLMNQLYSMEREEFVLRRRLLNIVDQGGRIRHLTEAEENEVHGLWTQNSRLEIPDRLILIGEQTQIHLGSVYHFLCTFAADEFQNSM